ncbi:MAG: prepilin-type N-terminal cleavage/methylation domain-containing protein [Planctomycetota bacterium]
MRDRKGGFTIVELLVVFGIIVLVAGILLPSFTMVRRSAKEVKQKAQLTAISLGLTAFKNDFGDYPESSFEEPAPLEFYCGAQKLAEALVGWDLMGFHPDSAWRIDGYDGVVPGGNSTYDPDRIRGEDSLKERKGYYLELETANVFRIGSNPIERNGLFNLFSEQTWNTHVICDVYGVRRIIIRNEVFHAGAPILYYRANTSSKNMTDPDLRRRIYNAGDNGPIINLGRLTRDGSPGRSHYRPGIDTHYDLNNENADDYQGFTLYINDYRVVSNPLDPLDPTARPWPCRPDSYLLISAGLDGLYGTADDITNFGN